MAIIAVINPLQVQHPQHNSTYCHVNYFRVSEFLVTMYRFWFKKAHFQGNGRVGYRKLHINPHFVTYPWWNLFMHCFTWPKITFNQFKSNKSFLMFVSQFSKIKLQVIWVNWPFKAARCSLQNWPTRAG